MSEWKIVYTKQAKKEVQILKSAGLKKKAQKILDILKRDHYQAPPRFEKLVGDLSVAYSRRINIQHRLVYQIYEEEQTVKVIRMWSHYE